MKGWYQMEYRIRTAGWLMALAILLIHVPCTGQKARDKEKLLQTKKQLEQEIRSTTALLEKTKKSKQTSLERIQILAKQIRSREALINTINQQLNEVETQITDESLRIGQMTKELQRLKDEYARMICSAYRTMNGNSRLMFIFSARDFNQAYQRLKYYQQYAAYRRNQAEKIVTTRKAIENHCRELEGVKTEKLTLVQNQVQEKQKLDREKTEKTAAVREFTSKEKQLMATLRKKQQAAQQLENEIEKLIAAEIRASEERAKKKDAKSGKAPKSADKGAKVPLMEYTPQEKLLSTNFSANRGRLPWPCDKGYISGSFGEHPHPVLEHVKVKNNGIDIMTEPGSAVKAVFGGKVSRILSFPNLNQVVIIRHGEYLTVYSNLDEVRVREGQDIAAKQALGKVHATEGQQNSELHFELWRGKVIQDPEQWLAGR